jgi:hypothetical protein
MAIPAPTAQKSEMRMKQCFAKRRDVCRDRLCTAFSFLSRTYINTNQGKVNIRYLWEQSTGLTIESDSGDQTSDNDCVADDSPVQAMNI